MSPKRSTDPILNGSKCPYCGAATSFEDSAVVYGKSYGMIYICHPCKAYVGVHKGTHIALGRLANAELRGLKKEAHLYFDQIWKNGNLTRLDAYTWLGESLDIPKNETHIGMFDEDKCRQAIESSKRMLNDMRRLDLDFGVTPQTPYYQ